MGATKIGANEERVSKECSIRISKIEMYAAEIVIVKLSIIEIFPILAYSLARGFEFIFCRFLIAL